MSQQLQSLIEQAWEDRANLSPKAAPEDIRAAVANVIGQLDQGALRVAEKKEGQWIVNQWVKKAVLLSFRLEDNAPMTAGGFTHFYDKVPSKFAGYTADDFARGGFRVVPPAVIIEDNCFIGARSEVVEGVIVEENSVISMGVYLGQSTKIFDRETGEVHYGRVPAGSVVVPGNLPSKDGKYSLYCAVIVKKVDAQTRAKTSLNELLRGD
ncbi:2,3,4,5-tetrahydropyridine-2,6-dicarboxylate N-succinyltransferase [Ralstonia solanacearum]|nr:2,3,4,5-tetrahydropyridine-2,6-dicarboxylate N-succinyltransferase [Ralstonia solanacearum]QHB58900.1 2,3,4,5-tetrahydropyridine-2,6-dicarboxylate N-succinyltransferase [Ralstonia solanacearum]